VLSLASVTSGVDGFFPIGAPPSEWTIIGRPCVPEMVGHFRQVYKHRVQSSTTNRDGRKDEIFGEGKTGSSRVRSRAPDREPGTGNREPGHPGNREPGHPGLFLRNKKDENEGSYRSDGAVISRHFRPLRQCNAGWRSAKGLIEIVNSGLTYSHFAKIIFLWFYAGENGTRKFRIYPASSRPSRGDGSRVSNFSIPASSRPSRAMRHEFPSVLHLPASSQPNRGNG
jgi:hypothetical protein